MTEKEEEIEVFPFIEGETVDLVTSNSKWANLYCKWDNDPKVRYFSRREMPVTLEEIKKGFESPPEGRMRREIFFTIYHKLDKRPIGLIGFNHINWINCKANIWALIGETEYWGRGIIVEAAKLLINYGFAELNLNKIYSGIFTPNKRSLRAAEKLGFKEEAILKEETYLNGKYVDDHKFALFKRDWYKKKNSE